MLVSHERCVASSRCALPAHVTIATAACTEPPAAADAIAAIAADATATCCRQPCAADDH